MSQHCHLNDSKVSLKHVKLTSDSLMTFQFSLKTTTHIFIDYLLSQTDHCLNALSPFSRHLSMHLTFSDFSPETSDFIFIYSFLRVAHYSFEQN